MEDNKSIDGEEERKSLTNEQPLNTASTNETLAASEPIAEAEQPLTINPEPSIILDMEVHHHAHDPAAPHHKKNWKSYFWEFLMLFLAVFCGFLAEYQLEHKIESDREKEYIQSMVEDLRKDTSQVFGLSKKLIKIEKSIDSILMYFEDLHKGFDPVLYRNLNAIYSFSIFIYTDRTMQQLKNSGGMRLIKNKKAADGILNYDAFVRNYQNNDAYVQRYWEFLTFQRIGIIDRQLLEKELKSKTVEEVKLNSKNYLLANDPVTLGKFRNSILELQTYHHNTVEAQKKLFSKAVELITILKQEYHLK